MTRPPHPGLRISTEERLRLMTEALNRGDAEPEAAEVALDEAESSEAQDEPGVVETPAGFDPEALADLATASAARMIRPEERPGDLVVQVLAGGAVGEEAMYQLGRRSRRAGWHYYIPRDGTRIPHRR